MCANRTAIPNTSNVRAWITQSIHNDKEGSENK